MKRKETDSMIEQDFVTRVELESVITRVEDRMTKRVDGIENEVKEHSKCITKVETTLDSLTDLPTILSSLNVTLVRLDGRLCNVEDGIKSLKEKTSVQSKVISQIDEKGKIDWMQFIKTNWFAIIMFIAALIIFLKSQGAF